MKIISLFFSFLVMASAYGATDILRRNLKLPSQSVLQFREITPDASGTLVMADTVATGSVTIVRLFEAQADVARNLIVASTGNNADIATGSLVVEGVAIDGSAISETFGITADATNYLTGTKAFAAISQVSVPVGSSPYGAGFEIYTGDVLGFEKCMDATGFVFKTLLDGSAHTMAAMTAHATDASLNTFTPTSLANGTRKFSTWFVQNYRCD